MFNNSAAKAPFSFLLFQNRIDLSSLKASKWSVKKIYKIENQYRLFYRIEDAFYYGSVDGGRIAGSDDFEKRPWNGHQHQVN